MGLWTRVRLPPAPVNVVRRDPTKLGGYLATYANADRRLLPLKNIRRDPTKLGGFLGADANVEDVCSIKNLTNFKVTALYVAKVIYSVVIFMV